MTIQEILGEEYREDMTAEEIKEAVAKSKNIVSKQSFDKKTSELVKTQKELKTRLTEKEQEALEKEQADQQMRENYAELLRRTTITEHVNNLISIGYTEDRAQKMAVAFVDGDFNAVIGEMKAHTASLEKKIAKDLLENTPRPGTNEVTEKHELKKVKDLSLADLQKMATENPEEFNQLRQGENTNG